MSAFLFEHITAEEFIHIMEAQDSRGKHAYNQEALTDWSAVARYETAHAIDPSQPPFVLIHDLPIKYLSLEHLPDRPDLIQEYSERGPGFPPIYVTFSSYRLQKEGPSAQPRVKNGNHRVVAALCQGKSTINAIMSQESWQNILSRGFNQSHRRNPGYRRNSDEDYRNLERLYQTTKDWEIRLKMRRMAERSGKQYDPSFTCCNLPMEEVPAFWARTLQCEDCNHTIKVCCGQKMRIQGRWPDVVISCYGCEYEKDFG